MKSMMSLFGIMFMVASVVGQENNDLKSYEYKNLKPGQKYIQKTKIYSVNANDKLVGPEYKNKKVWNVDKKDLKPLKIEKSERSKLTGPAYKNYRPRKSK